MLIRSNMAGYAAGGFGADYSRETQAFKDQRIAWYSRNSMAFAPAGKGPFDYMTNLQRSTWSTMTPDEKNAIYAKAGMPPIGGVAGGSIVSVGPSGPSKWAVLGAVAGQQQANLISKAAGEATNQQQIDFLNTMKDALLKGQTWSPDQLAVLKAMSAGQAPATVQTPSGATGEGVMYSMLQDEKAKKSIWPWVAGAGVALAAIVGVVVLTGKRRGRR
jgi:hypothetical protein